MFTIMATIQKQKACSTNALLPYRPIDPYNRIHPRLVCSHSEIQRPNFSTVGDIYRGRVGQWQLVTVQMKLVLTIPPTI